MAGYFQRGAHIYEGAYKAGEELPNGVFCSLTAQGVKKLTAAGDAEFRVVEKTTLWGKKALRLVCVNVGTKELYFTESEIENYGDKGDFNDADYSVAAGHYVKMRRPDINDMVIMSVGDELYAALAVDDIVLPAAGGLVAKKS